MYSLSAFRAYDIRGLWGTEIDEQCAYVMGYALVQKQGKDKRYLIASDVREANMLLIDAFMTGMHEAGVDQVTILGDDSFADYRYGVASTPLAYTVGRAEFDITVVFSASHNAKEYVGLKIVDKRILFFPTQDLRQWFTEYEERIYKGPNLPAWSWYGGDRVEQLRQMLKHKFASLAQNRRFAVDFGHGAAVWFERMICDEVFSDYIGLFTNPDGEFPAHETDTSRFSNYKALHQEVVAKGLEFGFMFDGDADRLGVVLVDGRVVTGDIILAIVAKQLLTDGTADRLGTHLIYQEVFCGKIVGDVVRAHQGRLGVTRVGRGAFAKQIMDEDALLAGEVSAHLLFKELGHIEMPLLALYYLMKEAELFVSFTAMIDEYSHSYRGQILHFACENKDQVLGAVHAQYISLPDVQCHTVDGVRVDMNNGRFCVRKSGTEPIIKLALEADTKENHDLLLGQVRDLLVSLGCHEE